MASGSDLRPWSPRTLTTLRLGPPGACRSGRSRPGRSGPEPSPPPTRAVGSAVVCRPGAEERAGRRGRAPLRRWCREGSGRRRGRRGSGRRRRAPAQSARSAAGARRRSPRLRPAASRSPERACRQRGTAAPPARPRSPRPRPPRLRRRDPGRRYRLRHHGRGSRLPVASQPGAGAPERDRTECRSARAAMELAGLEPATSWVRSRRSPN
jgi:hypothetical protein